ncbi:MAG: PhzF family phenazine biosynthesis protein [Bdellovibrionales bacterium]|nr:PhzF family phenazine biosynthesis protein [Bdellovibrionales bacterium]
MSTLPIFIIDAFTTENSFSGNMAAVCPLSVWLENDVLQAIAAENNLSETAFFIQRSETKYDLRWFTPKQEVDLCGHATLASAYVIFNQNSELNEIEFNTRSGPVKAYKKDGTVSIDMPTTSFERVHYVDHLVYEGLRLLPDEFYQSVGKHEASLLAVFSNKQLVAQLQPDFDLLKKIGKMLIVTAPGVQADFVSRMFAPNLGINEDPVTGSAHCFLAPYWANRLGKNTLTAKQLSQRGGDLTCEFNNDRTILSGSCHLYLEGKIFLP